MKVILFGRNLDAIRPLIKKMGFKLVESRPNFVISYGGDGTLMQAEEKYPGIPKIILKGSLVCKKASCFSNEDVLKKIKSKRFKIKKYFKLEAVANAKKLLAVNDIVVHNKNPRHAIRYKVWIGGQEMSGDVIGDGVVIATPFGSTAYYRSITDSFFEIGIGLAFNNSTEQFDHMVLDENKKIKIKIIRGPAVVYADNQEKYIEELCIGSEIIVKKSNKLMKVVEAL